MNQKNSLGLDISFKDLNNPIDLFKEWYETAKKSEINNPNAFALATSDKKSISSVRTVLLKNFNQNGFVFYTNLNSKKSIALKENPNASMCFYWKSLNKQIIISGKISKVSDKEADTYYRSRSYESRIGAWASNQSSILNSRKDLYKFIEDFKKKYSDNNNVPRPIHWSGWNLNPNAIEFWMQRENRIHERLLYSKNQYDAWSKSLLNP